jgi:1,4-alpha-glucan branching enzyme
MSLKKQYLKTKPICKVTFRVSKAAAKSAQSIHVVGDFNNWSVTQTPMRRLKSGEFTVTVDLETSRAYEFRYIIDGMGWENDWEADRYVPSKLADCDNSVVVVD